MWRNLFFFAFFAMGISACKEIKIQNGQIPNEYMNEARQVVGTYQGTVGRQATTVTIELIGNYLIVSATPDILGGSCGSQIGDLLSVLVGGRSGSYYVERATLAFNPNNCLMIEGRELNLGVRRQNGQVRLTSSVLERSEWRESCEPRCTPNGCTTVCNRTLEQSFVRGDFVKTLP